MEHGRGSQAGGPSPSGPRPIKDLDPDRRPKRTASDEAGSCLRGVFFVVGSLLNVLALILMLGNIFNIWRQWTTGGSVSLDASMLAPLGAFLMGMICFVIAYMLDQ